METVLYVLLAINCLLLFHEQECIPVGCVPPARLPYAGVCFSEEEVPAWSQGGCTCLVPGGVYLPGPGGVPAWSLGVYLVGGVPAWSRG